jgi:hypothetical protein
VRYSLFKNPLISGLFAVWNACSFYSVQERQNQKSEEKIGTVSNSTANMVEAVTSSVRNPLKSKIKQVVAKQRFNGFASVLMNYKQLQQT